MPPALINSGKDLPEIRSKLSAALEPAFPKSANNAFNAVPVSADLFGPIAFVISANAAATSSNLIPKDAAIGVTFPIFAASSGIVVTPFLIVVKSASETSCAFSAGNL